MLVNAVEQFDHGMGVVHQTEDQVLMDTLNANTIPFTFMTRFLGPQLKARAKRGDGKRSAIITMSSMYAQTLQLNLPIFCAGKSFTDAVNQVVGYENPEIDVLTVRGLPVKSSRYREGVCAQDLIEGVFKDLGHERLSYGISDYSLPTLLLRAQNTILAKYFKQ